MPVVISSHRAADVVRAAAALALTMMAPVGWAQTPPAPTRTEPYSPAVLLTGQPMALPHPKTVGSCEVALEVTVEVSGMPASVDVLRSTAPCTEALVATVKGWRFTPADEITPTAAGEAPATRTKVRSKVLIVAVVNAQTFLGPTIGTPPAQVKKPSSEIPWPSALSAPTTSPMAFMPATTMVEARIGGTGRIDRARVVTPGPPYDDASLAMVRGWTFSGARRAGRSVPSNVYVIFGFPTAAPSGPVTPGGR